jgi:hypothetical protein
MAGHLLIFGPINAAMFAGAALLLRKLALVINTKRRIGPPGH